jgi:hypothetical protein
MQCFGAKINGHCIGGKTKVCNWSGWKEDIERTGKDLEKFAQNIDREWKRIYRNNLPENIRQTINSATILFAGAYALGVSPEVMGYALTAVVGRTVVRSVMGKEIHSDDKPWIEDLEKKGNALIASTEASIAVSYGDAQRVFKEEIDNQRIWTDYLQCLSSSASETEAIRECYIDLDDKLHNLKREVVLKVLQSEL